LNSIPVSTKYIVICWYMWIWITIFPYTLAITINNWLYIISIHCKPFFDVSGDQNHSQCADCAHFRGDWSLLGFEKPPGDHQQGHCDEVHRNFRRSHLGQECGGGKTTTTTAGNWRHQGIEWCECSLDRDRYEREKSCDVGNIDNNFWWFNIRFSKIGFL